MENRFETTGESLPWVREFGSMLAAMPRVLQSKRPRSPAPLVMVAILAPALMAQSRAQWDSLKAAAAPRVVAPSFLATHGEPRRLPMATSGWEDGLQVSPDGLDLYALYLPADFLSWSMFIGANPGKPICDLLGTPRFRRADAPTFGSDQATNPFGCSSILNVDILRAHRESPADSFANWTLTGLSRPLLAEGGPFTLPVDGKPDSLSHVLFTGDGDIWMVRGSTRNLTGIDRAVRLPTPINPVAKEFVADNPALVRLGGDSLLLVYERYTDGNQRTFMLARSPDGGTTWGEPTPMTSITRSLGHIEHPMPVRDLDGTWWLWFSIDYDIVRAKALVNGQWDSWATPEKVLEKGNTAGLGEPSLSRDGTLYFSVVLTRPGADSADRFDIDPWVLPVAHATRTTKRSSDRGASLRLAGDRMILDRPMGEERLEARRIDGGLVGVVACRQDQPCGLSLPRGFGVVTRFDGIRPIESRVFALP